MTNEQAQPQGTPNQSSPAVPQQSQAPPAPGHTPPSTPSHQPSDRGKEANPDKARSNAGKKARKAVDDYLRALEMTASGAAEQARQRGRVERAIERNSAKITELDEAIASVKGAAKLDKLSERSELQDAVEESRRTLATLDDLDKLEAEFLLHAKAYGDEKRIPLSAWLEAGVSRRVLKNAGIV